MLPWSWYLSTTIEKVTKTEIGTMEWALAVTSLTMLVLKKWRRFGDFRLRKCLNTINRPKWAVIIEAWKI